MSRAPTLLEDLDDAASRVDCRCRDFGLPCAREELAARLRAHAARLRVEMEDAVRRAEWNDLRLLDRINDGPAKP